MNEAREMSLLPEASAYGPSSAVRAILAGQSLSGAFVASPDFTQYQYCWLRDGSFVAYALDLAGAAEAAGRFHLWCAAALERVRPLMERVCRQMADGGLPPAAELPPARYSLNGTVVADDWPNFQVDGYGTWLWSLSQHLAATGQALPSRLEPTVRSTAQYLATVGMSPCYDPWEEHGTWVHTATLGCVSAGLAAAATMLGDEDLEARGAAIAGAITDRARLEGYFRKANQSDELDAAVLWLCQPLGLVDAHNPAFAETTQRVARELDLDGGTRRYRADTFYGGGAWPVLTASLGLYYADRGETDDAGRRLAWISGHVDERGRLAEQYGGEKRDPHLYNQWVGRWGPPAADLLWSHAMYLVLYCALSSTEHSAGTAAALGPAPGEQSPGRS